MEEVIDFLREILAGIFSEWSDNLIFCLLGYVFMLILDRMDKLN